MERVMLVADASFELDKAARFERRPDCRFEVLGSRRSREAAGDTGGEQRQRGDLHAGFVAACGHDPAHPDGERALDYDGPSVHPPSRERNAHFLVGLDFLSSQYLGQVFSCHAATYLTPKS